MDRSLRFRATHRFRLCSSALPVVSSYVDTVCAVRGDGSRSTLDAAKTAWASKFGLAPDDGLVLTEFAGEGKTLGEVRAALELCGCAESQLRRSIERCLEKGFLETAISERARGMRAVRSGLA